MASKITELRGRATEVVRHPRTKKIAIWIIGALVALGILGALVAPPLLRRVLANQLTTKLHRQVSIEQIRINPYTMTATIRGFLMKERQSPATAVSFDELHVNLELLSLFQWGAVLKEIRLVKPYINLVRNEDLKYNFQDLIDEFMSGPSGPTPRFSLNNIQVIDGKIDFDDRSEHTKHVVAAIKIGVPFISSIPSYVDITVQPEFSALVNGAPFVIGGETKPFKDSRESTINLAIDKAEIPKYLEYSPVDLNFKVPSGQIDGKLTASFKSSKDKPSILVITGNVAVKDFIMQEKGNAPLLKLPSLEVVIDAVGIFAKKATIRTVKVQSPELFLQRKQDGNFNLTDLINAPAQPKPPEAKKDGAPFTYLVSEILLESGKLHLTDETPEHPFREQLEDIRMSVKDLTNEPGKKASVEISFQSANKEQFIYNSTLQLTPLLTEGNIDVKNFRLGGLRPYYETVLGVEITEGLLDLSARVGLEQRTDDTLDAKLSEINASLRSLRLDIPGDSEPLWRAPLLAIKDAAIDIDKRVVTIGSLESRDGNGFIRRDPDGTISYARLIKTRPAENRPNPPAVEEADWTVQTKRVALNRFRIVFEDRALKTPTRLVVSELSAEGENFSNVKNSRAKATIQAKINDKGKLKLTGTLGTRPVAGQLDVEAEGIEIVPFQPYMTDQVNFLLTGGAIGTKGKLTLDVSENAPTKVNFAGNLQVNDFGSVEKNGSQDLLKWKSLALDGIQFALEPMQVRVNEVTLADFYSRVILGSDGKINLQNLTAENAEKKEAPAKAGAAETPAPAAATSPGPEKPISIGKINLQNGNIDFSDFFIKPNYSANLTSVQGTISELKPETPGDVMLDAKLDNAAPVDIRGKINPLSKDLYLDIVANAKEIELNTFSPYSGKYVGYGIEKGKLSFNVKYKVENRKLSADNTIILNQLTFGEKVDSPEATNLPVLLAVALLKDRNGVIDINLPISGSLDDPQFSVGGIVLKIIFNIITKAVTAPFALLGAIFGGGSGEELSYVEFDYGRATLTQVAEAKLKTLATAMNNRPALKLEISGHVDPVNDLEGLKKASIERKVKAQKMKDLVRQGTAPRSVDDVKIEAGEYPRYLKEAYGDESFPKPRNIVGLAKDLPVDEMESLMLKNTRVTDDDLRELASRRAQAVRDRILGSGQVTSDRLFIVASKPASGEDKENTKARASRVDFAFR